MSEIDFIFLSTGRLLLWFGCWIFSKGPCVRGLVFRMTLLVGSGAFRRWGLLDGP
jgi:hypothetical protein